MKSLMLAALMAVLAGPLSALPTQPEKLVNDAADQGYYGVVTEVTKNSITIQYKDWKPSRRPWRRERFRRIRRSFPSKNGNTPSPHITCTGLRT